MYHHRPLATTTTLHTQQTTTTTTTTTCTQLPPHSHTSHHCNCNNHHPGPWPCSSDLRAGSGGFAGRREFPSSSTGRGHSPSCFEYPQPPAPAPPAEPPPSATSPLAPQPQPYKAPGPRSGRLLVSFGLRVFGSTAGDGSYARPWLFRSESGLCLCYVAKRKIESRMQLFGGYSRTRPPQQK